MEVARLKAVLEADTRQAETDLARAGQAVDRTGQATGRGAGAAQAFGRAFQAAGATAGYAFAAGIESASAFQDQLDIVNTIAHLSDEQLAGLGDQIQQVSRDTGVSTEELTMAYYDLLSAGSVATDDITGGIQALEAAVTVSKGALGSTGDAIDTVTTVLNAWGMEASEAGRVTDVFAVAVEKGKVTLDEIGASIANAAPLAASMGIEMEEVSAAYSTLTARGVPASEAMTQMNAAMRALINPNEQLNAIQERTGINFAKLAEEQGLQVALQTLREATEDTAGPLEELAAVTGEDFPDALASFQDELGLTNSEVEKFAAIAGKDGVGAAMNELIAQVGSGDSALAGALGRVEGFNFVLQTTGDAATGYAENLNAAFESTGTAAEQAAERYDSPGEAANRLTAQITTFMQDVAGPFTSTMGPVLLTLNNLGPAFMGPLSPVRMLGAGIGWLATKGIRGFAGGLRGGVGALKTFGLRIAKTIVFIGGMVGALIVDGVRAVGTFAASLATTAASGLKRFGAMLLTGITTVGKFAIALLTRAAMAVGAFAASIVTTAVPALIGFAATIWTTAIPAIAALVAPFLPIILIVAAVVAAVAALWVAWENNFLGIRDIAETVWNAIVDIVGGAIEWIGGVIGGFMEFIGTIWDGVVAAAQFVWDAVSAVIGFWVEGVKTYIGIVVAVVGAVWDGVVAAATFVWDTITGIIEGAVGIITGVIEGITGVVSAVWDTISGFFDFITGGSDNAKKELNGVEPTRGKGRAGSTQSSRVPPQYAKGTLDTGPGGLAYLHPREAVLPAEVAAALRSWLGAGAGSGASNKAPYQPSGGTGEMNVHNHYTAQVAGILPARSVRDVGRGLRELGENGRLVRRTTAQQAEAYSTS